MEDELPASLIEKQAQSGVGADDGCGEHDAQCGEKPLSADERLLRMQRVLLSSWPSSGTGLRCGWRYFFSGGRFFRHFALSKCKFVCRFERCSADAADHCGAVAADERIVDFSSAIRAPESDLFACGWIRGRLIVHSEDER